MKPMIIPPSISINNLCLSYDKKPLFHHFHITIPSGKWVVLLGPSGIGKTTLLRIIAGLPLETNKNDFSVQIETSDPLPLTHRLSYLSQRDMLLPWLTAIDNVLISCRLESTKHLPKKMIRQQAETLLNRVGLSAFLHYFPHRLSGGMRQRVSLARALMGDHSVVLMDEPFSALDAITRFHLQNLAIELLDNKTVLLVTHDPLEAIRLADIIYILSDSPASIISTLTLNDPKPRDITNPQWITLQTTLLKTLHQAHEVFHASP